ncbi:MAG: hypothetical protein V7L29_12065 [Nostoc sp.]
MNTKFIPLALDETGDGCKMGWAIDRFTQFPMVVITVPIIIS